jgi:hypothetical protein
MNQESEKRNPIEEAGGYGTPTAEQEMPGADNKKFAQPRDEEAFDAAGLSQDSSEGEKFPAGSPDLSQFGTEDKDSSGEPGAGRFGGTEDQMMAENESTDPGFEPLPGTSAGGSSAAGGPGVNPVPAHPDEMPEPQVPDPTPADDDSAAYDDPGAAVPSSEAEMEDWNTEDTPNRAFSSEPKPDAAGIPDGSGTDLPDQKSPRDRGDGEDTFDAG